MTLGTPFSVLRSWGLGLIFLIGLAGKDREVGGRVSLQVCGLGVPPRQVVIS